MYIYRMQKSIGIPELEQHQYSINIHDIVPIYNCINSPILHSPRRYIFIYCTASKQITKLHLVISHPQHVLSPRRTCLPKRVIWRLLISRHIFASSNPRKFEQIICILYQFHRFKCNKLKYTIICL